MAQAAMPASPFISTALYIRLSVEDNNKRGNSIETQKLVLEKFLLGKTELRLYDIYIDNGATGTNFNRDGFQRMLSDIESGKVGCVIVKDLSRLGRNAIDTGYYIERYFPSHNVRFISVTDQFDSENPDNLHGGIILPLKNMINEAYALDIGRKIKAQARQDMKEGMKTILKGIDQIKHGISMCIFPEGTRNDNPKELLPFKEGSFKLALKTGCPIIPIAMTNTPKIYEAQAPLLKKTHVVLHYGKPILPNELDADTKKHIGVYTKCVIEQMLEENEQYLETP